MILESNAFAPVVTGKSFRDFLYRQGADLLREARAAVSSLPAELAAFVRAMDATGPWQPVPILLTANPPGGPVDETFFRDTVAAMSRALSAAGQLDAVYVANHGAMTSTEEHDADGALVESVRRVVGEQTCIVMTLDLHANVSQRMVERTDCIVGYLTNPHVDQIERGEEAAFIVRLQVAGQSKPRSAFVRLPLTPPSVTLLTAEGPYADIIEYGQRRRREHGGAILNVSVLGGFVFSDTPKNGIAIVVTARDDVALARDLADEIAHFAWAQRRRFVRTLTSIDDAVALARSVADDSTTKAVIFSDAGDNPGGGGSGTTIDLLRGLIADDAGGVLYAAYFEPDIAAKARSLGVGTELEVTFNHQPLAGCGEPLTTTARVVATGDGEVVGRRGIYAGRRLRLGPSAALALGASSGITVVVISLRVQAADPVLFESLGLDIAAARTVVVKSRGHFRAGFDLWFEPKQVFEVDTAGLTSPVLQRFNWLGLPRPVFPLDPETQFN